jgi:hypothetical protein
MTIWQKIQEVLKDKFNYDEQSQIMLDSFPKAIKHLEDIDQMKKTVGWNLLEQDIRKQIKDRIFDKIKDDLYIQSLMNLLILSDTKTQWEQLEEEIDKLLPQ